VTLQREASIPKESEGSTETCGHPGERRSVRSQKRGEKHISGEKIGEEKHTFKGEIKATGNKESNRRKFLAI